MIGLDTNIAVRFFVEDDPVQFRKAGSLFASFSIQDQGFISLVALAEFAWVLQARYHISKLELIDCLGKLTSASELVLENQDTVLDAVDRFASGRSNFSDYLIERSGNKAGCDHTLTFDRAASKSAGMRQLK
jgi:predicted nucleic-acid-binding protein